MAEGQPQGTFTECARALEVSDALVTLAARRAGRAGGRISPRTQGQGGQRLDCSIHPRRQPRPRWPPWEPRPVHRHRQCSSSPAGWRPGSGHGGCGRGGACTCMATGIHADEY